MSKILSPEKKIVCLKDDISYKPNNCNKPMGKFSSAYCTQNSRPYSPLIHRVPCSAAAFPQIAKGRRDV